MHCGGWAAAHVAQSHSEYFPFAWIIAEERRTCKARLQLRRPSNEIMERYCAPQSIKSGRFVVGRVAGRTKMLRKINKTTFCVIVRRAGIYHVWMWTNYPHRDNPIVSFHRIFIYTTKPQNLIYQHSIGRTIVWNVINFSFFVVVAFDTESGSLTMRSILSAIVRVRFGKSTIYFYR